MRVRRRPKQRTETFKERMARETLEAQTRILAIPPGDAPPHIIQMQQNIRAAYAQRKRASMLESRAREQSRLRRDQQRYNEKVKGLRR